MKKFIKKFSKKTWVISALFVAGNIVFIGTLYFMSSKADLAKTDWKGWGVTELLYWLFWSTIWFAKKTHPMFNAAIRITVVEPFVKQFKS